MMRARLRAVIVVLALTPALTSCWPFRKSQPTPPPANPPVQFQPPLPPAKTAPAPEPEVEAPPSLQAPVAQPAVTLPSTEPEPLPGPERRRPSPVGPPVSVQPQPEAPPQLRPILTPAQRRNLERTFAEHVNRTQTILRSLEKRRLTADQTAAVSQIRTFLQQSEEARKTDLLRANNLAERAEVLAQDLTARLR